MVENDGDILSGLVSQCCKDIVLPGRDLMPVVDPRGPGLIYNMILESCSTTGTERNDTLVSYGPCSSIPAKLASELEEHLFLWLCRDAVMIVVIGAFSRAAKPGVV